MLTDAVTISLNQAGIIFNVIGIAIPMVLSMAVVWFYQERYFRYWTVSYMCMFLAIFLGLFSDTVPQPFYLASAILVGHLLGTYFLFRTAFALWPKEPSRLSAYWVAGLLLLVGEAQLMTGHRLEQAVVLTLVANLLGHCLLGWTFLRMGTPSRVRYGLAWMSLGIGAWGLTYPFLGATDYFWTGYVMVGFLHLALGVGMTLFLFEENARRLEAQNAELRQLDELKNNFISTISHEFRTPLTAIKSASWFAPKADAAQLEFISQVISENVDRLAGLLNDVLDYSKMEAGVFSYEFSSVDLVKLAEDAIRRIRGTLGEKALSVVLEAPPSSLIVYGDEYRLGQVLDNLLSNAAKFTPEGERVTVTVVPHHAHAAVEVADTGIGIPLEEQERIFTKFYQVEGSARRKAEGTGLGLAIARSIVEEGHGGSLEVSSEQDHGSVFTMRLPLGHK